MGKYKTTRDCIHAVNQAKTPLELKSVLQKHYPDAFINWELPACHVGDILSRTVNEKKSRYLIVKTSDNKSAILNLGNATLWKHFSTDSVLPFDTITIGMFSEMTNGMSIDKFKKERKR